MTSAFVVHFLDITIWSPNQLLFRMILEVTYVCRIKEGGCEHYMLKISNEILVGGMIRTTAKISHGYDAFVGVQCSAANDPLMDFIIIL